MKNILLLTITMSFMGCGLCLSIYSMNSKKVVYIDINHAVERAAVALSKTKLSQKMQTKIMKGYSSHLNSTIKAYGHRNNMMIVISTIMTTGKYDITNEIVNEGLKRELNNV